MKRLLHIGLFLVSIATLSSCVKNEYYNTTPTTTPTGYQSIFDDNFDYDAHNWSFTDAYNNASVRITSGQLKYVYNPGSDGTNTVAVNTGLNVNYNFLIQTRMQSNNAMGLVWGVSNNDYGYSLFIDDQGYFALYKEGNANTAVKTLIDWQYNSAIVAGWNNIEVEQQGDYWIGYANGTKLFEIGAQNLYGSKVGYIVMAGTTGYADYLTVQW